tara:strand:+ start:5126 stop:5740 length:615 start_codon:yes stop_codon:yes gene_type:complete
MIAHSESFKDLTKGLDVLLSGEFKVPVFFDRGFKYRRSQYFNIEPISSDIVELRSGSQVREFSATIKFYWHRGGNRFGERSNHVKIMNTLNKIMERSKQLLTNNSSYTVDNTPSFSDINLTFSQDNTQFVYPKFALTTTFTQDPTFFGSATRKSRDYIFFRDTLWYDGKIESVNYDPPRNDTEQRADLIMTSMLYSTKIEDVAN